MGHHTFFTYYLPALEEALQHDHEWEIFHVKGPGFYYAGSAQLHQALEAFIEAHCEEIPLFDRVGLYFDAMSHNFGTIDGIRVQDYKTMIRKEAASIKHSFEL